MLVPAQAVTAGCLFVARQELPPEQLALAEPLSCVVNGQRWSNVEVDDVVLVMGAGPIGLFHLQLALLAGARAVIVSEPSAPRRSQAERLGATITVDPAGQDLKDVVDELSGGVGTDSSVVCVGVPQLVNQAIALSRSGGRVNVFAGLKGAGWTEVAANRIHYKQVRLTGSTNSRRADYETALRLIETERVDTASMVTHRFPLSAVIDAVDTVGTGAAIKVAVLP
jgi:L-iditol 2-dehydrogenase